jgi:putative transposase
MPHYVRFHSGSSWFFTVVTYRRITLLTGDVARPILRQAIIECKNLYPFNISAWVLLPDHLHCIWELPESDLNYSRRWAIIKRKFTQRLSAINYGKPPYWQNRFWAHLITDEKDFENHMNYIHYNPVKHGLVERPRDWPWSSLQRLQAAGTYPLDWWEGVEIPERNRPGIRLGIRRPQAALYACTN